ncbi:DNA-directed RNA polymerase II subunit RPB9 (RNA polymerase II subunit B9) (DNA-directed RNA polymerase II subunit I) [Durusdinium trenchii]|uniref:DNA-directed RNA polymerase II subunit RPB9 (RNA polymerase II subunit B9) (DNA-directed RNA polymerase II subunit I) n=2 Tax=Durusdinium trenchii TaxID=1381693 RepID=A0ABP0QBG4_9DINO
MASYKSTLRFCPECNNSNWMMGKNEKMELVFTCKVCSNVEVVPMEDTDNDGNPKRIDDLCVFRHDVLFVAKESIIVMPDVIHDPTLPRVYDYDCHVCGHNQAVYYRLSETIVSDAMAIIYVCCECSNWRTEGKEVQYSVPQGKAEQTSALPELDDKAREEVDPDEVEGEKDKPSEGEEEEDDITKAKEPR